MDIHSKMKKIILFIILYFYTIVGFSQLGERTFMSFLGINPQVHVEKNYPAGAFDINILPIAYQCPLAGYNLDFRLMSIVDYAIRPLNSAIKNIGFEIGIPYHFNFERKFPYISKGFFLSPGFLYKKDIIEMHRISAVFFEFGYNFHFGKRFSIMPGLQYGRKFVALSGGNSLVLNYYNVKLILGFWLIE